MTTENTINEDANNNAVLTAEQVAIAQAEKMWDENTSNTLRAELARLYLLVATNETTKNEEIRQIKADEKSRYDVANNRIRERDVRFQKVEDFIIEHIKNDDDASVDELKELANAVDIELTQNITVKFTVECEYQYIVPLDFNLEDIDRNDFDVTVQTNLTNNDDFEEFSFDVEITDFNVDND